MNTKNTKKVGIFFIFIYKKNIYLYVYEKIKLFHIKLLMEKSIHYIHLCNNNIIRSCLL